MKQNLTAQAYLNFLRSQLPTLLQILPNDDVQHIYFQQDGCPSHNARIVVQYLNSKYGERWLSTYGPISWLNLLYRAEVCLQENGLQFEHLL
ncbi:hypothetical protein ALC56_00210 [Trachymyrmex septentrionalis]|uniref:Tc1-like transposase DDE domain-containing protein n=1 Tax=Trachymyrmex septentrionalis TaxID=34720 RepID=A0A195FY46_9HYME|nr:hypothetical protein ALC56_00210 [Trachymyrmex septentrionalis]